VKAQKLTNESSLSHEGTARKDDRAPGGYEFSAVAITIMGYLKFSQSAKDKSKNSSVTSATSG
jgi:aspartyl/asparaginyl-tRNA synthetase